MVAIGLIPVLLIGPGIYFDFVEVPKCEKLDGCEEIRCLADKAPTINWKNRYELEYQSCLMEIIIDSNNV